MKAKYVKICKRLNNNKRKFLVLNEAQCKHVPFSPTKALKMFDELASKLKEYSGSKDTLVIGFSETATAIGWRVAESLGLDFIQTTRESFSGNFFQFSEVHSHATEQKLYADIDYGVYKRIIFVEDEVTTGNTMLNIISVISKKYVYMNFVVASILNGMSDDKLQSFSEKNIKVEFLLKVNNYDYDKRVEEIESNNNIFKYDRKSVLNSEYRNFYIDDFSNPRKLLDTSNSREKLDYISKSLSITNSDILILGTEEFMYPAIYIGSILENVGKNRVCCHSTTRSPIVTSDNLEYPLNRVSVMPSVYDIDRVTYLYNLRKYDKVIVITEGCSIYINFLVEAISDANNTDITVVNILIN